MFTPSGKYSVQLQPTGKTGFSPTIGQSVAPGNQNLPSAQPAANKPPSFSNYWKEQESGILPWGRITDALAPTDNPEGINDPGTAIWNIGKSAVKAGVGFGAFLDPVANIKKIGAAGKELTGFEEDFKGVLASQGETDKLYAQLEQEIIKSKQAGKDTSRMEEFLAKNRGNKKYGPLNAFGDVAKEIPGGIYSQLAPPAVQEGFAAGKEGGFMEGLYTGVKSVAEDPYQLLPAGLMLKGAVRPTRYKADGTKVKGGWIGDTKTGQFIDKTVSNVAKPVTVPAGAAYHGAVGLGKTLASYGVSQVTGLSPGTINRIISNPKDFSPSVMKNFSREGVASEAIGAVEARLRDLSETGKEYKGIRGSDEPVILPKTSIDEVFSKNRIGVDENGKLVFTKESIPTSPGDRSALQEWYDTFGKDEIHSTNSFLNARKGLDNLAQWDSAKTDAANVLAMELRAKLNEVGRPQVKGLEELDTKFSAETTELKQVKKDYFNRDGSIKDGAISKIANLSNKGRESVLARLEAIRPGIAEKIITLRAIEDIHNATGQKVGTYTRAAIAGGGLYTGNIPAIVAAILASPKIATQILRGYGKTLGVPQAVVDGIVKVFTTDLGKFKAGLSIEDVSKDTITLYRAAPNFPTDNFKKGTYFADDANKAGYYSQSHYKGNPQDIKIEQFTLPKDAVFREPSTGNYVLTKEVPVSKINNKVSDSPLATEARKKADTVLKLMGNELEDINIVGSTARGKLNPNDLDILITPKKQLGQLDSNGLNDRIALQKTFEDELGSLFPGKKIHVTISKYDSTKGPKMAIGDLDNVETRVKAAADFQPEFQGKVQKIADDLGLKVEHGPVKTADRVTDKLTESDIGGDLNKIGDFNRAVVFVDSLKDIGKTLSKVVAGARKEFGGVQRVKLTVGTPGYNKVLVNVKTPAGMGEIQLTTKQLWDVKMGGGDKLYGLARKPGTSAEMKKLLSERMDEVYSFDPNSPFNKAIENTKQGGFTVDLVRNIDYAGTPHIAISPFPERTIRYKGEMSFSSLADYIEKNQDLYLSGNGYVTGGWYNAAEGISYLDVTVPVPKAMAKEATKLGKASNQIAGFDLEDFKEFPLGGTGTTEGVTSLKDRMVLINKILANLKKQ